MSILKPLYRLKKYLIRYKRELGIGLVLIIFSNILHALLPKLLQFIIDAIDQGVSLKRLAIYATVLIFITLIYSAIRFLMRKTIVGVSRKVEYQLRNDYFSHLQQLSLRFFVNNKTGDLMARATNDVNAVSMTIGMGAMFSVSNSIIFVFVFIMMITTNVKLALLALIPFPFILILMYFSFGYFFKTYEKVQEQYASITAKAQENISGIRVIKAYIQEKNETDQFKGLNRDYLKQNLKLARARGLMWASMEILFGFAFVILLWVGGNAVISDQMTIGDLVAFNVWLGMLGWPMISLGWVLNLIQRASASMKRINEIMDTAPLIQDTKCTDHSIKTFKGEIEFKDVSFAYDTKPVLKNINLKINPGMTLAIIGPTGSGKTTLINLIPRLIDANDGQLLIDGVDVRCFPLKVLRKHIGFVPQETFLFSETIEENISFGVENARPNDIEWAAKVSTIQQDLENFPDRYQTLIGERGVNLSGGQKQRTAISRALLRRPKILILDDALSSVDTYTEEKILTSLMESYYEQTTILISHRISTVKQADLIIVLDEGEIIEQGRHEDLVESKGFYAELHQQQLLEEALKEM
ncbi:MAG: ABC transporter ATP-binding protein [bacterium]|nr:MAG: ABC transporter ATP-binding protein [bacterium]